VSAQTLRLVTALERRYASFDGLNLTWETLEGVVKHNGPLDRGDRSRIPSTILDYDAKHHLELASYPGPEAQVAALSDDIAYNNHDIDDALRAGLFDIDALEAVPLVAEVLGEVRRRYPALDRQRLTHEVVRRLISRMVEDLIAESRARIARYKPECVGDVRTLKGALIGFSDDMAAADRALKDFLFERMYRHSRVNRMGSKARRVIKDLFALFLDEPQCLPETWRPRTAGETPTDETFIEIYSLMSRRPDGRSLGFIHDMIWQFAALMLCLKPLSEEEYTAIFRRLAHSARDWRTGPSSRFYINYLRGEEL